MRVDILTIEISSAKPSFEFEILCHKIRVETTETFNSTKMGDGDPKSMLTNFSDDEGVCRYHLIDSQPVVACDGFMLLGAAKFSKLTKPSKSYNFGRPSNASRIF
jgi:hypothetical protein